MARSTKDTFGYVGTESTTVRELLEQLSVALEEMAKAEGAEAMKGARETARRLAREAESLVDDFAAKARDARAVVGQHGEAMEGLIRERPWLAVSLAAGVGFLLGMLVRR
ncbi:MAG: DUF883 family protein [Rhodospirillales bacterium]|nr:DUF883 family protein [Rhodospirillales bacterium]